MVSAVTKKLNLVISTNGGGKTITLLNLANELLDSKGDVIYVTLDNNLNFIKKTFHCLYNDTCFLNIKHENDDKTPIGLQLPHNLSIIDSTFTIESIKATIVELTRSSKPSAIFIDPINFISDYGKKSYKEKMESIFLDLEGLAELFDCPVIASMTVLSITDFTDDFFKLKGAVSTKIERLKETKFQLVDLETKAKKLLSLNFKNSKLVEVDVEAYMDAEIYD